MSDRFDRCGGYSAKIDRLPGIPPDFKSNAVKPPSRVTVLLRTGETREIPDDQDAIETNKQLESQIAKLTAKIDELDYREVDYIDEILDLKEQIKKLESENSTLEEQIELMGGY